MAASLEEAREESLTFDCFPASQPGRAGLLPTTPLVRTIEQLQEELAAASGREDAVPQGGMASEKAAPLVFSGLVARGQVRMRRLEGWFDLAEPTAVAA